MNAVWADVGPKYILSAWASEAEYRKDAAQVEAAWHRTEEAQQRILGGQAVAGSLDAYCFPCDRVSPMRYSIDSSTAGLEAQPNWRESLICECGLINRIRASLHLFMDLSRPKVLDRIYATEEVTPLFEWLADRFPVAIGSEFVDAELDPGTLVERAGRVVRHEDLTRLSFATGSLDHILSFDVLEHVPDYRAALTEMARCLAPDGTLLLSAPFDINASRNLKRATIAPDGIISHIESPEYHGDPMTPDKGVLCFQTFGWQLIDELRSVGFADIQLLMVWSEEHGYLGWGNVFLHARRALNTASRSGRVRASEAPSSERDVDLETLLEYFRRCGHTDEDYLRGHFGRFRTTLSIFRGAWPENNGRRLLDVGAHWLHQAALWAASGFRITALDLPETFSYPSVRMAASQLGIDLLPCPSLEHADALVTMPDDSFDVILFTEILEHLTFNPVAFWRQIHRVLAPGGRILLTTPNAYRLRGQAWRLRRYFSGRGFGIPVEQVIGLRTRAHHWKEYSRREVEQYFKLLSPDFHVRRSIYVPMSIKVDRLRRAMERALPFVRENLHVEIDLPYKRAGITAEPGW